MSRTNDASLSERTDSPPTFGSSSKMAELRVKLDSAAEQSSEEVTEQIYRDVISGNSPNDAESIKCKEEALQKLCDLKVSQKDAVALRKLLTELRPLFAKFPKAKTAKMVRNLIDAISKVPDATELQVIPTSASPHACLTPCVLSLKLESFVAEKAAYPSHKLCILAA